jgi:hypothetical protein
MSVPIMLSKFRQHITLNKTLLITVIISSVLHALLLTNFSISLPLETEGEKIITMTIISNAKEKKLVTQTTPTTTPQTAIQSTSKVNTDSLEEQSVSTVYTEQPTVSESQTIMEPSNDSILTDPLSEIMSEELINDQLNTSSIGLENIDSIVDTPHHEYIETEFEVRLEDSPSVVANTRVIFDMRNTPNYKLTSLTEAKGIGALIFGKLEQVSEGLLTENGLEPTSYTYRYGSNDKKFQHAKFLWAERVLEMYSKNGKKVAPLSNGTQDLLSFMYQYMFTPPLNNMQITMTNGKSLQTYTYTFQGEELINTKLDKLNTIHLMREQDDEKTEVWLATDYQNLPVKIRKTEKNGRIIDQTISRISTEVP